VPCDFIGIVRSQQSVYLKGEIVSNHDELMSNFFAQVRERAHGRGVRRLLCCAVPCCARLLVLSAECDMMGA